MSIRSKLFATVALPVLSLSLAIEPAMADSLRKSFQSGQEYQVAQAEGEASQEEEVPRKRKREQAQQEEEQPSRSERRKERQAEQQQSEEQQPSREERRKQRQAEQQQSEEQQPSREERRKQRQAEQQQSEEQQPSREERRKQRQAEQQQSEEQQPSREERRKQRQAEQKQSEEQQQSREERRKQREAEQQADQQRPDAETNDDTKAAADRAKAREERRKKQAEQQGDDQSGDQAKSREERAKERAERRQREQEQNAESGDDNNRDKRNRDRQQAGDGELRPGVDGGQQANDDNRRPDRRKPVREVKDERSKEEKQRAARDPSKTDDTVVLPVENGAAVLDSDKDADNADANARDKRRRERERARAEDRDVAPPKSDAEAQRDRRDRRPSRDDIREAREERGKRLDAIPAFAIGALIGAAAGAGMARPAEREYEDRTVLDFGDQIIVRGDDRPRLRRDARDTYYEELSRGRSREVIERPNGVQIVTIYNRYGDVLQRTRVDPDGRETLMIYAPERDDEERPPVYDAGYDLPPMRLQVPVRDYIIDTSTQPDRDYYEFLAEPPVEQVERTYTIDEVRNSARIRDKMRRIDLDTITFATGSSEVPMSQAKTLRKVADAMLEAIDKDPGETFFIEGHTDAVGSDESNLVLSDERAESVAALLTEVYEIPPENLVTQGYGERYLKVRTDGPEEENRRVAIRRVTPLVRPVAQN